MFSISRLSLLLVSVVALNHLSAQKPADTYKRPLADVLKDVQKKYNVALKYDERTVNSQDVSYADWRFASDVKTTLDNILRPLDLVYEKTGANSYTINRFDYYRRSEAEGKKHLDELLAAYPTAAAFSKRKIELKACIASALGISSSAKRTPLNPVFRKKVVMDGYTVENVMFESIPGYYVTGTLYRPAKGKGPFPVVLNPHGHFFNEQNPSLATDSGRYRADMQIRCASLAKMGAIALSYDMYGWGESELFTGDPAFHETGFAASIQTWNSIRAIDFLLSLPNADPSRVAVTGASGGGTQTILAAALDDRVTVTVPAVMVSSAFYGGCPCESGLPIHGECNGHRTNNTEIAAMIAPRPMLLLSDGDDWTRSVPGTDFPYLQKIYGMYGKQENVESVYLPNDKHDYGITKREPAYRFLAKHLGLNLAAITKKDGTIDESKITIQPNADLHLFVNASMVPSNALRTHEAIVKTFRQVQQGN